MFVDEKGSLITKAKTLGGVRKKSRPAILRLELEEKHFGNEKQSLRKWRNKVGSGKRTASERGKAEIPVF